MRKILIFVYALLIAIASTFVQFQDVHAMDEADDSSFVILDENGNPKKIYISEENIKEDIDTYSVISKDGNQQKEVKKFDNYESALKQYRSSTKSNSSVTLMADSQVRATSLSTTNSIVRFKTVAELDGKTIDYKEMDTGRTGYFSTNMSNDAAYISTEANGDVICKLAGVVMKVPAKCVKEIVPYTKGNVSYYYVKDGHFTHYYSYISGGKIIMASTRVGYKPSYLTSGKKYYSYDGHYFYDTFEKMIIDYKNYQTESYEHAVNKNNPYYNYYQYLPLRSKTTFTASQFNKRIASKSNSSSKMYNKGQVFIDNQNKYGINASLMFGIAYNESQYGESSIAQSKNNLFGLNAVDKSPSQSADYFKNVDQCIKEFADHWMSKGYLNGSDWRYRGPHLGDKRSGINVKYASDPYWGEKGASQSYYLEGVDNDYLTYNIGISNQTIQSFYKECNTNKRIYTSEVDGSGNARFLYDYPVNILSYVVEGTTEWCRVQSDMPLKDDRSARNLDNIYKFSRDYVYAKSSEIDLVHARHGILSKDYVGTYDGKAHSITISNMIPDSKVEYSLDNKTWSTKKITRTGVGTTTVYYRVTKENVDTITGKNKITINKATYKPTVKDYNAGYDSRSHSISLSGVKSGSKITYRTSPTGKWTTTKPTRTKLGTTTVYYQITHPNYNTVTGSRKITISKRKVSTLTYSKISNKAYTGKQIKPSITVKYNGKTLKNGTDYTISYGKNKAVGNGSIKITGKGNYTGSLTKSFKITKRNVSTLTYSKISNKSYTGKQIKPSITVKYSGKTLKKGTDYTVSYGKNKSTGKGTVKITGKGNYTGSITKTFYIVPKKVTISSAKSSAKKKLTVKYKKVTGASGYQIAYQKSGSKKWTYTTVSSKSASKTLTKLTSKKNYKVKVRAYKTVSGKKYYGTYSATKTVKVK